MRQRIILVLFCLFGATNSWAQGTVGLKTNLLYGVAASAPNLGVEIGLGRHTTLDISGGYNWFNLYRQARGNRKLVHWLVEPEFRYFTCERFNGHFFGAHALFSMYNIGNYNLPMLLGKGSKDYRYQGFAYGLGVSYGYQLMLGRSWNLEFNLGLGYIRMQYDKYECPNCGTKIESNSGRNYFGPTKAGISIIYIIN